MTIRTRLVLGYAIGIATTIAVVGGLVWWQMSDALLSTLQSALQTRSDAVLASLENQGQSGLQESDDPNVATWVVLADQHGQPIDASVGAPAAVPLTAGSMVADGHRYLTRVDRAPDGTYVVTGADLARVEAAQAALARIIVGVGGLVGAASLFLAWLLAGRALRPIERLITDADDLRPDDLDRRLAVPRTTDEVGRLAATLNRMLDRISDSVARQRLFVALASHELRTPLAALRAELDVADGDNTSVAEYRAAIREARVDAVRLGSLTAGLLELAKVGDEARPVARTPVSVSDLASSASRAVQPVSPGIARHCRRFGPGPGFGRQRRTRARRRCSGREPYRWRRHRDAIYSGGRQRGLCCPSARICGMTSRPMSSILEMSLTPRIEKIVWCDPASAQPLRRSMSLAGVNEPWRPSGVIDTLDRLVFSIAS